MARLHFDIDVLRSFVVGVELGSFAKAADRLGRSTSAISAQLKKLEDQVGTPVLRKAGRGLALTDAGEAMLGYARRLLELNDEAAAAVRGVELAGRVRLGLQEDFGERVLPDVLGRFARAHPRVRIEVRIARNQELMDGLAGGRLDLALAWDGPSAVEHAQAVARPAMCWIGAAGQMPAWSRASGEPLPLAVLDAPCLLRSAATAALDRAGIPWRVVFTSASLAGTWAAVHAGLGLSVRTPLGLPASMQVLDGRSVGLPALGKLGLSLYRADETPSPEIGRLAQIILHSLGAETPTEGARWTARR